MGARLLHRTTRRLSLTGPGEEALNRARAMLALGDEMEQLAVRGDDAPKGQLRVTSSYSLSDALLVKMANDYLGRYPGTAIDILLLDRTVNLVEERIDLALRITNDLDPNLVARRLGTCHSVVCASPAYLARHAPPQQVQDLALHNCLTYTYFGKSLWEFQGPHGPESVPVSGNLSANISNLLLSATLDGAGISLQPRYSVQSHLESGALVPLLSQWQPKRLGVYAVYGTRKQMSPLLRSFLDFLVARMADDPLWQEQ
ncbi:LysR family transcriptional regulator, partial [Aeromonas taiwanensis]